MVLLGGEIFIHPVKKPVYDIEERRKTFNERQCYHAEVRVVAGCLSDNREGASLRGHDEGEMEE